MNNLVDLSSTRKYLKGDLIGATILIIIIVLVAAPVQFFGILTTTVFVIALLNILLIKRGSKFQKFIFSLGRKASITSLLGIMLALGMSLYGGSLFTSMRLVSILLLSLVQVWLMYKMFVDWSIHIEDNELVQLKDYKKQLLIVSIIFIISIVYV